MGKMKRPDRSALSGGCRITRILPRFLSPFGARSLAHQGFARRPIPGGGGKSSAILTPETAPEKSGIRVELPQTASLKGGKKPGKTGRFRPVFLEKWVGREWHSRGQRFDPAYLHQGKRLETSVSSLFYDKFRTVFPCRTAFSANWAAPLNQLHYHHPQLRLDGRRTVPVAEKCTCPSHCLHTPIGYV